MPTSSIPWKLIDLDTGDEFVGDYPADEISEDQTTVWSETHGMGRESPVLQWTHGASPVFRFRARIWGKDSKTNTVALVENMRRLTAFDQDLNRPHVFRLVIGSLINERVVVESLGDIKHDSLRQDGSPRGSWFTLVCRKYVPFDLDVSDPNAPQTSTRYYRTGGNETFEHVAAYLYRDPNLGDLIRRRNPSPILETGSLVVAPEPEEVRREMLEPYSIPFVRTARFVEVRQFMFNLRNVAFRSSVLRKAI